MPVPTLGAPPARLDLDVRAGEPVDFSVPVLDATGAAQPLTGWSSTAQVRASATSPLLHTFTVATAAASVRVTATAAITAAWIWQVGQWDIVLTSPGGVPHVLVAGWIRVYPTITR